MDFYRRWSLAMYATAIVAAVVLGCSSDLATTATPSTQATPLSETQSETPVVMIEETSTPEPPLIAVDQSDTIEPLSYDPSAIMYRLFPGVFESPPDTLRALEEIQAAHDVSQVPVLLQTLRFLPRGGSLEEFAGTLRILTGKEFGGNWREWMAPIWRPLWPSWRGC